MPSKAELVEQLKELGIEASVDEKTTDLQKKLDDALAAKNGEGAGGDQNGADGAGAKPPEDTGTKPPAEEKPKKTQPVLKCGVYHMRRQYDEGTVCPPELEKTFRALNAIEDRPVE